MTRKRKQSGFSAKRPGRRGMVLVAAVIVLVVLASLTAAVSIRVTQTRRRQQYMIDYQQARYACDSAMKYMLAVLPEKTFKVEPREGLPDFSDLFWMDQQTYEQYIRYWLSTATEEQIAKVRREPEAVEAEADEPAEDISLAEALKMLVDRMAQAEEEEVYYAENPDAYYEPQPETIDPNQIEVPGPYGVPWPYVMEPVELELGSARITITVEDENAKMPLGWAAAGGKVADAAVATFCEWMQMNEGQIKSLQEQCDQIEKEKKFVIDSKPILLKARTAAAATPAQPASSPASRFRTTRTAPGTAQPAQNVKDELRPAIAHAADFGKLFHSALLDAETLARPLPGTGERVESVLRYLALWGSQEVNINTAPRHVLEAAFTHGGEPKKIVDAIIEHRKTKPFRAVKELEELVFENTQEIRKAQPYITMESAFFQVRVTARSGLARCTAAATVFKDRKNVQTLALMYSR